MVIQVDSLTKRYGTTVAVDDLSCHVDEKEIVGFLGPNGAGKSTTMRILTCFMPATSGSARVMGHDVFTQSHEVRRCIGYMPEGVPLYPEMRVVEYLRFRAKLKGVGRKERKQRVTEVMGRCDIEDVQRKLIGQLSKGYRQRVGLADALVGNPPVLILDEPTIGLDPNQIRSVRRMIRELSEEHTVLLSSHILPEVEQVCSRVLIVNQGRVVYGKSLEDVKREEAETAVVRAQVRGPADQVKSVLADVPGVQKVTQEGVEDGVTTFTVKPKSGADVREEIFRRVAKNEWVLRELTRQVLSLEDIFVQMTAGDAPEEVKS